MEDYSLFRTESLSCRLLLQKFSNPRRGLSLGSQTHVIIAQLLPLETEGADHTLRNDRGWNGGRNTDEVFGMATG